MLIGVIKIINFLIKFFITADIIIIMPIFQVIIYKLTIVIKTVF